MPNDIEDLDVGGVAAVIRLVDDAEPVAALGLRHGFKTTSEVLHAQLRLERYVRRGAAACALRTRDETQGLGIGDVM
jgi:hypothetical protein